MSKGENIFKRKDGRWEARYIKSYDENRKIHYGFCYGHSYREAKEKVLRTKATLLSEQRLEITKRTSETFSMLCRTWLNRNTNNLKPSSLAKYQTILKNHILPEFGVYHVEEINTKMISKFTYKLQYEKRLSSKTVRDILMLLHKILVDLQVDEALNIQPVTIICPKPEQKTLRVLTNEEQRLLINYLSYRPDIYKFSILLALTTGLRIGEVCALRWQNISVKSKTIVVKHTVQRIKNPDITSSKKTVLQLDSPKTSHSYRMIPLTEGMANLCKIFQPEESDIFVLTGTKHFADPRQLQRKLKKYTKELNMQDVHFHTLRHTFATRCVEVGCDIKTLSEMLGHSSVSMTMNCYVHPSIEMKRHNIEKLEQAGFDYAVK